MLVSRRLLSLSYLIFSEKSNLTITNRLEMSKILLPQSENIGCEEYTEKNSPCI